jgi:tetratricopeptide (TPR) repeat protein
MTAALTLGATVCAFAQNDAPLPKLKVKPKPTDGTILVVCDIACTWALDGRAMGFLAGGENKKEAVSSGRHLVGAVADGSPDKVKQEVVVKSAEQSIVRLELQPVQDARIKAEQDAAARQRDADAAAERQREQDAATQRQMEADRQIQRSESEGMAFYRQGNYAAAGPLFEQACRGGNMDGCTFLGWLYQNGNGVTQDYAQARSYYQKACDGKDLDGCRNLGVLFEYGWGAGVDYEQARSLYQMACDGRNAEGCGRLGDLYLAGKGVTQDTTRGRELIQMACSKGVQSYCEELKKQQ